MSKETFLLGRNANSAVAAAAFSTTNNHDHDDHDEVVRTILAIITVQQPQ